jgi:small subunit ribosomal protein S5
MAKNQDNPKKEKVQSEFEEKVLYINRCSKVVKGGRKFSFSALILVGDGKGKVGCGFGKANELTDAIRKGGEDARKNMISFPMEGSTIPHEVFIRCDGAILLMKPAKEGTGLVVGSKARPIFEMAGIKDVMVKTLGSSNPLNLVHATFQGLKKLRSREQIKQTRG